MMCVHPNGKHIFWVKLVDWNAKKITPSFNCSFQLPPQTVRWVEHLHWMLSDCSAFCCPGGSISQIRAGVEERLAKRKETEFSFWSPWMTLSIDKLIFLNTSLFFKCNRNQAPVFPRNLIWLNLIYHIVTGLIFFYSKSHAIFYLLFIVIFIFISQLRQILQRELALISNLLSFSSCNVYFLTLKKQQWWEAFFFSFLKQEFEILFSFLTF